MTDPVANLFNWIEDFLPQYLTPQENEQLVSELKRFPERMSYYLNQGDGETLLQGDVLTQFPIVNFDSLEKKPARAAIVLSNSCDISADNRRDRPILVTYCPLIRIRRFEKLLLDSGRKEDQVGSQLEAIRKQRVSGSFYLPGKDDYEDGEIVFFDDIHSVSINHVLDDSGEILGERLSRLSQAGFYLFLIKISIHFCRFQEGVSRFD